MVLQREILSSGGHCDDILCEAYLSEERFLSLRGLKILKSQLVQGNCSIFRIVIKLIFVVTVQDNDSTLALRQRRSDAREIQTYYQQYYNDYVKALDGAEHSDRFVVLLRTHRNGKWHSKLFS